MVGPRPVLKLAPELTGELAEAAQSALPALSGGPEWRLACRVNAPWGSVARLRPYLEGIEVRGADCVLHLRPRTGGGGEGAAARRGAARPEEGEGAAAATSAVFERDPAAIGWPELGAALRAAIPRLSAATKSSLLGFTGDSVTVQSAERLGAAPFVELRDGADPPFVLGLEVTLAGSPRSLDRALFGLPWRGTPASDLERVDLRATLDPVTLALVSVEDLRFLDTRNGTALVFDPNPVVTSGQAGLRDGMDVDEYRKLVTVPRLDGSGRLRGTLAEAVTDVPPDAFEPGLSFAYSSRDPRFEAAMAYVFGDRSLDHADSLGFHGLFSRPLRLRLHATAADNSWYSRPTREIVLGDGGVDDAEDADIILHETGHALHDALVPGFGSGDTRAISEGFSDFWAASLTGEPCIGDWDATSYSPPCLRRADESAIWPVWLSGQPHHDGAIWSGLLWELRERLGRVDTERLALAGLLEQGTATTWPEAARGLMRAARRLGLEDRIAIVEGALADRGLVARSVEFDLAAGESRRLELLASGRFLGRAVQGLEVRGDGQIVFAGPSGGGEEQPFPAGPPTAIPCGIDAATASTAEPPGTLRLAVRCTVEGAAARLRLSWIGNDVEQVRLRVHWDGDAGSLEWEYEDARPGSDRLPFFTAVSAGGVTPDLVSTLQPASIPEGGLEGLQGFLLALDAGGGDLERLVGARFRVEGEAAGGFRLQRTAPAMAGTGHPLILTTQPNPFRTSVEIRIRRETTGPVRVAVFNALGRRVRDLGAAARESGVTSLQWDGRDDAGRALPGGIYWVRAESAGNGVRAVGRVVLMR